MKRLGVITPYLSGSYCGALVAALYRCACDAGAELLVVRTGNRKSAHDLEIGLDQADAWVVLVEAASAVLLQRIADSGRPVCTIGHDFALPGVSCVRMDNRSAMREAMDLLYSKGHRAFAFVGCSALQDLRERQDAVVEWVAEHPDCAPPEIEDAELFGYEHAAACVARLIARGIHFTALLAGNDTYAIAVIAVLRSAGLKVPDDVVVTGFDNTAQSRSLGEELTTVDQNLVGLATCAFHEIQRRLANPSAANVSLRSRGQLIPRTSTGDSGEAIVRNKVSEEEVRQFVAAAEELSMVAMSGLQGFFAAYTQLHHQRLRASHLAVLESDGKAVRIVLPVPAEGRTTRVPARDFPRVADGSGAELPGDYTVVFFGGDVEPSPDVVSLSFKAETLREHFAPELLEQEVETFCEQLAVLRMRDNMARTLQTLRDTQSELMRAEKAAALSIVVAGISHELNTPLGNCTLALSSLANEVNGVRERFVSGGLTRSGLEAMLSAFAEGSEVLERNIGVAARLVSDLRKLLGESAPGRAERLHLETFLRELLSAFHQNSASQEEQIKLDVAGDIYIESDRHLLAQVVSELVDNAMKHGGAGRPHAEVELRVRVADQTILVEVVDNGPGLPPGAADRVFDPFFTTRMGAASGLGLAMVYSLVTGPLKGKVWVESVPECGARFVLALPRVTGGA